jgi:tripartite-type tricarboxylate transporter receptor subunit TctC
MSGLRLVAGLALLLALAASAAAQSFSARPITLSFLMRRAAMSTSPRACCRPRSATPWASRSWSRTGRVAAGSSPATTWRARRLTVHTLFVGSNGPVILGPLTMAKPAYQWEQAFAPMSSLAVATNLLVVRPSLPVKSVQELVDYARANPGKLTLATSTIASINHFLCELFKLKAGIGWTEVHYLGNALIINDLLAGYVDASFLQLIDASAHLQTGKLRALAVPGKARAPTLPDVLTMAEARFPEIEGVTFNGIFAPHSTPRPVVDRLSAAGRTRWRRRPRSISWRRSARRRAAARRRNSPPFCKRKRRNGASW